ncbi:hypothetical protein DRE_01077 [Drechslerella stenobrocha 248]|uniref:Uncharacterized protein n=1 Tax=Drechslerella stenobrocha 248 TaxID=1043628 RepID=W7HJV2_9PEZI|nr:hypothetical protein DRE_01077 [Drechslerella stenobrocha 248]
MCNTTIISYLSCGGSQNGHSQRPPRPTCTDAYCQPTIQEDDGFCPECIAVIILNDSIFDNPANSNVSRDLGPQTGNSALNSLRDAQVPERCGQIVQFDEVVRRRLEFESMDSQRAPLPRSHRSLPVTTSSTNGPDAPDVEKDLEPERKGEISSWRSFKAKIKQDAMYSGYTHSGFATAGIDPRDELPDCEARNSRPRSRPPPPDSARWSVLPPILGRWLPGPSSRHRSPRAPPSPPAGKTKKNNPEKDTTTGVKRTTAVPKNQPEFPSSYGEAGSTKPKVKKAKIRAKDDWQTLSRNEVLFRASLGSRARLSITKGHAYRVIGRSGEAQ